MDVSRAKPLIKPRTRVCVDEVLSGESSDVLFKMIAGQDHVTLLIRDLLAVADRELEPPHQHLLCCRTRPAPSFTVDARQAVWPLSTRLPLACEAGDNSRLTYYGGQCLVDEAGDDPFAQAARWAQQRLLGDAKPRSHVALMEQVYRICTVAAVTSAEL